MVYAEQKRREASLIRIQSALALAPDDPEILENVAIAYEKLGERAQSVIYAGDAIKKGLSFDEVKNEPRLQSLINDPEFQRQVLASSKLMK
jgi:tetratricopeptide (TPR) repeat protein